jgi:hypothetical protein
MSATEFTFSSGKWTIDRDPNAILDYKIDLTEWLDAQSDALLTAVEATDRTVGVVVDSVTIVGKTIVVWISGGTIGDPASVTIRFTTSGGRTDDRSLFFKIKEA